MSYWEKVVINASYDQGLVSEIKTVIVLFSPYFVKNMFVYVCFLSSLALSFLSSLIKRVDFTS